MAHRSHIIATACEVAVDRRLGRLRQPDRDQAMIAAARSRVGGSEADMAAAEFWVLWAVGVVEELENGEWQLRDVITRHRLAADAG